MTGLPMPDREYTNVTQMIVNAPDPATAQAALAGALAAITTALEGTGVRLLPEVEDGRWVLSQR
jgi:hypothetical protein